MRNGLQVYGSTLVLARGELAALALAGGTCGVSCLAGRLWVTAAGNREDAVLSPGETVTFRGKGKVVVEALRMATVRFEIHVPARVKTRVLFPPMAVAGRA
jgi:hypothetical protein